MPLNPLPRPHKHCLALSCRPRPNFPPLLSALPFISQESPGFQDASTLEKESIAADKSGEFCYGLPGSVAPFEEFDPFNLSANRSEQEKARGLVIELNNGRLAMLGMMAFVSEAHVPGAVPALAGLIKAYDGEVMAPF